MFSVVMKIIFFGLFWRILASSLTVDRASNYEVPGIENEVLHRLKVWDVLHFFAF